ncbi:MAG: hypothetical protein GY845_30390 [Planctomycetes bacterium]|nr:hypothetical protein [Planctomycetota bacterium]
MPISNYPNGFANGINIQGLPVLNTYGGTVYWVDDSGSDGNPGTFSKPFASIDYAIGKCTAGRGDMIMVKPGHSETLTASITCDVAGVKIVGLGGPGDMPAISCTTATDVITVTAANVTIANIEFAVPGLDAVTADINIAAAGCSVINTRHHGSTTSMNKVDIITITSAGDDFLLDGVRIFNDTVEVVGGIAIEGACARGEIRNCFIMDTVGFTNGALSDEATATELFVHHNVFSNAKAATVVMEFGNNSTGVCSFNHINGRHTTLASNVAAGTGMAFFENRVVEEAAVNGAIVPAADTD